MNRRDFLARTGLLGAAAGLAGEAWVQAEPSPGPPAPFASLQRHFSGRLLFPGSPAYAQQRWDYNHRIEAAPAAIALCASPADVIACVQWARQNRGRLSSRSGGHSYEGFSLSPGLVADVGPMAAVKVDPAAKTAVVGAGARLEGVYDALWRHGLTLPGGACPTVGISGLTLGGGFGLLSRKWGLTADNLLALEMVNAEGRLVTVSQESHPDLFWACRGGGGGQFGIVTSFTFRVHPIGQVALYEAHWPAGQAEEVIRAWQDWAPHTPDELTCEWTMAAGGSTCKSVGQFVGSEANLRAVLAPLTRTGSPTVRVWTVPFIEAVRYFGGPADAAPVYLKAKSDYVQQPLGDRAIKTLLAQLGRLRGAAAGWIQFDSYGGAVNRAPQDGTAFVHRAGNLFSIQYNAIWSDAAETPAALHWIREFYASMRLFVSGYSYVNYCDLDLKDWPTAYYGGNLGRLERVKGAYDPGNLFRFAQSIAPAR